MDNRLEEQVIHNLLNVMTLELIEELTTASMGVEKMSLTQMMEGKFSGVDLDPFSKNNRAKILPFESKEEETEVENAVAMKTAVGESVPQTIASDTVGQTQEESTEANDKKYDNPLYIEEAPPEEKFEHSTSDFILLEKERLKQSQYKLKKKTILDTYQKVLSVDLEQEKANKDNLKNSANSGVLVNKKQF